MKHTHTPGPWFCCPWITSIGRVIDVGAEDGSNVAQVLTGNNVASDDVAQANARLIAASPDLVDALANLLRWAETGRYGVDAFDPMRNERNLYETLDAARAALWKATGEQA